MGFEDYKVQGSPFDLYYDKFLQNTFQAKIFRIVSKNGDSMVGIPTASSIATYKKPRFIAHYE